MKKYFKFLLIPILFFTFAQPVLALDWYSFSIVPAGCRGRQDYCLSTGCVVETGKPMCKADCSAEEQQYNQQCCCDLTAITVAATNIGMLIMAVIGSVVLVLFVIGGVMYMTSGGSPDKVKKATSIITNSVIGLAIILLAGAIIKILIKTLTTPNI